MWRDTNRDNHATDCSVISLPQTRKSRWTLSRLGNQPIEKNSGTTLMAEGPQGLHEHIADKIEKALGHEAPKMDVRFSNLSLSADIVVVDNSGAKYELPTIPNTMKKAFVGPKKRVVRKEILKDISGVFAPGNITLLLGQPGSG
ncbi:unnamed protein product [Phytophthora lilii]|uniref:Unnamed protein product n=1 Tax=Phytophthora lilii TaxID=2077276 RepID=A0A9W6TPI5_9STRA|nr:unnamed protein product [Phytophthora lilii]